MPLSSNVFALFATITSIGAAADTLSSYNVDPGSVSVSGLSAGGFMAVQLGVAYSDVFKTGFGVFAGGPYDCARSQSYMTCMYNMNPSITASVANMKAWSGSKIAPLSNLAARKIYMEVGSADYTVGPNPMAQLKAQLANFDDPANTTFYTTSGAGHTFPTDFDGPGDNECSETTSPFISNCGYDGAGEMFKWMYGNLNPRSTSTSAGQTISFAQTGSYGAPGLDSTGYLYVPSACSGGSKTVCKLHVALHGCKQGYSAIGNKFITNTGYTQWAETNKIIVLFPQAMVDNTEHTVWSGTQLPNPMGCFDWVGWYGSNDDQIGGVQLVAIINAVKTIIGGSSAGGNSSAATPSGGGGSSPISPSATISDPFPTLGSAPSMMSIFAPKAIPIPKYSGFPLRRSSRLRRLK